MKRSKPFSDHLFMAKRPYELSPIAASICRSLSLQEIETGESAHVIAYVGAQLQVCLQH